MRRTLVSLAAVAALGITLTACGGSDDEASSCSPATAGVTVAANDDLTFDEDSFQVDAGCVEITYENNGTVSHTLLVKGKSGFKLAVGKSDKGTIDLDAGSYTLYCDISGHEAAGMKADLTIS